MSSPSAASPGVRQARGSPSRRCVNGSVTFMVTAASVRSRSGSWRGSWILPGGGLVGGGPDGELRRGFPTRPPRPRVLRPRTPGRVLRLRSAAGRSRRSPRPWGRAAPRSPRPLQVPCLRVGGGWSRRSPRPWAGCAPDRVRGGVLRPRGGGGLSCSSSRPLRAVARFGPSGVSGRGCQTDAGARRNSPWAGCKASPAGVAGSKGRSPWGKGRVGGRRGEDPVPVGSSAPAVTLRPVSPPRHRARPGPRRDRGCAVAALRRPLSASRSRNPTCLRRAAALVRRVLPHPPPTFTAASIRRLSYGMVSLAVMLSVTEATGSYAAARHGHGTVRC